MKLYTEDQLKRCFSDAQMQWANYRFMYQDFEEYKIACSPVPIELPSDEKLEEKCIDIFANSNSDYVFMFHKGAKWALEQIKKQAE